MAINFPVSLDNGTSLPNPSAGNAPNNPSHAGLHDNENAAIIATQTKLGTGASTPTSGNLLVGTGVGTSAWTKAAPTGTIVGTTDVQDLSNKTATSLAVDTLTGKSVSTAVTVAGLAISSGVLNTNNSVKTSNYQNASVTADKLATGAQASAVLTSETTTSTSYADLATVGPSVTVTIGANGLALLMFTVNCFNSTSGQFCNVSYAASGANTTSANDNYRIANKNAQNADEKTFTFSRLLTGLSPGSTTFTLKYDVNANTGTFYNRYLTVIPL